MGGGIGANLPVLPLDPVNTFASGKYYTYVCDPELTAMFESDKFKSNMLNDGGDNYDAFEIGTRLTITPHIPPTPLDNFNRADGALGPNWVGDAGYSISGNEVNANASGLINWSTPFGPNQEAYVTIKVVDPAGTDHDLNLKLQTSGTYVDGVVQVWYIGTTDIWNPYSHIRVVTYAPGQGWVLRGVRIPLVLANGDALGAMADTAGLVTVYLRRAGDWKFEKIGSADITAWPYYANGGYIGLDFVGSSVAVFDNFGGGTSGTFGHSQ